MKMEVEFFIKKKGQFQMPDGSTRMESWNDLSEIFEVEYDGDGFIDVISWQIYSEVHDSWIPVDLSKAKQEKHLGWELVEERVIERWQLLREQEIESAKEDASKGEAV